MTAARCTNCTTTWTGERIAHCAGCHETFTTVANFDTHRVGPMAARTCTNPAEVGLAQNSRGQWATPDIRNRWTTRWPQLPIAA